MSAIALVAVLALAFLPTAGRVLHPERSVAYAALADAPGIGAFGAICTTSGLSYSDALAYIERSAFDPQAPAPVPPRRDEMDCDYCLVHGHGLTPAVAGCSLPLATIDIVGHPPSQPAVAWQHPSGLGSRGPPV